MPDQLEKLSAMVDDELLDDAQCSSLIDQMLANRKMQESWRSYHLIGEVLRQSNATLKPARDIEVKQPVPAPIIQRPTLQHRLLMPVAAVALMAVTASTTMVLTRQDAQPGLMAERTMLDVADQPMSQVGTIPVVIAGVVPPPSRAGRSYPVQTVRYQSVEEREAAQRLNSYLVNFTEERINSGMPGMQPYGRVIGYEAQR
ncbi:MAG: sigma-E factor negative regulatory protein [Gammaproteobacteria bacterium]|nr:sigma-E factor negative regulatory protein [Gammaproteobacteria bacterium]